MKESELAGGFSTLYAQLLEESGEQLREPKPLCGEAGQGIREELVRCLWFGTHFRPDDLATDDGRRLEVVSPGWWNVEAGPDFIRAELLIEGVGRVVGDVEVHTRASDWFAHGHASQPGYDGLVLHVVMWDDAEGRGIRLHSGRIVPQLTLAPLVEQEIGDLVEIVDLESPAPGEAAAPSVTGRYCGPALAAGEMSPEWLGGFLDCAGDHRVLTKADRMLGLREKASLEQVLYECVAEALGYRHNRLPFLQLANALPLSLLRETVPADSSTADKRLVLEALLFGVGGFLEGAEGADADEQTLEYLGRLRGEWAGAPEALRQAHMGPAHWSLGATRPVNYPVRRIAALAAFYAEHLGSGLFGHLVRVISAARAEGRRSLAGACRRDLLGVFAGTGHPYWEQRCTFGGRKLRAPTALVGQERAQAIVVDVALPLLLAHSRAEGDEELARRLHLTWRSLRPRTPNSIVRRMEQVLFQDPRQARTVLCSERRQQGLHQLHRDFCSGDSGCTACLLYRVHRVGRRMELT